MDLVLINDDGFDAPGLAALVRAVRELGTCHIVAPAAAHSNLSHAMTTDEPIAVSRRELPDIGPVWVVGGRPADCARLAICELVERVDWVLSGINRGANAGVDAYYSGTVAAAREAAILGKPAVAFSQYVVRDREVDWDRAARWVSAIGRQLLDRPPQPGRFWNVNLPVPPDGQDAAGVVNCPMSVDRLAVEYEPARADGQASYRYVGAYTRRPARPGTDVQALLDGHITVTPMGLSLTDEAALDAVFVLEEPA